MKEMRKFNITARIPFWRYTVIQVEAETKHEAYHMFQDGCYDKVEKEECFIVEQGTDTEIVSIEEIKK